VSCVRQGLLYDPRYDAFSVNFVHVHHQWSERLCKENRFSEAAELLIHAAAEMPNRDRLRQDLWEIYRRLGAIAFRRRSIDQALAVFADARSRHGSSRELLEMGIGRDDRSRPQAICTKSRKRRPKLFDGAMSLRPGESNFHQRRSRRSKRAIHFSNVVLGGPFIPKTSDKCVIIAFN